MVAKTKGYEAIQYLTSTDFQKSKWSKEQHEIYKSAIREYQLAPQIDVDISEIYTSPSYAEKLRQTEMLIDAGYDANFVGVSQKVKDRFNGYILCLISQPSHQLVVIVELTSIGTSFR